MSDNEEIFQLNDNGTVTFQFSGITRLLRRPSMETYRTALEALGEAANELTPAVDPDNPDKPIAKPKISVQFDILLAWFDDVFTALAGEGLPSKTVYVLEDGSISDTQEPNSEAKQVIDQAKLPSWLIAGEVVTDLVKHWQNVPSRHGGR